MDTVKLYSNNKIKEIDRWEHIHNLIKIAEGFFDGTLANYKKIGLQYVEVPQIVGITGACENVDTLFKIGNRLNLPLFMTQTGQLSLEQALQSYPGVFTIIHSGRDEEEEDERHLRQFRLTEEEFDATMVGMSRSHYDEEEMYENLLKHIELATKSMIVGVLEKASDILENKYGQNISTLQKVIKSQYLRINYEEAIKKLNDNGYKSLKFGDDLKANHEQSIVDILNTGKVKLPVFIMRYPKEIKFFNMKVSEKDPRVVLSADLIFPLSGESTGSAVREHDGQKLKERLLTSAMYKLHTQRGGKYDDFRWYLDDLIMAKKTQPHAGYGIGNERVLQFILGQKDIRTCSLFSLMAKATGDWDTKRKGLINFYSHKKNILLSIGKLKDKKRLLKAAKNLYEHAKLDPAKGFILYSTKNTHKYLKANSVDSVLVYKIHDIDKKPNIKDLIEDNFFDLIINIPSGDNKTNEMTDGRLMRREAVMTKTAIITDVDVAIDLLENIVK